MNTADIEELEKQIQTARKRGDGREVGRLRAELPFEDRQRIFGEWRIAAGRQPLPQVSVKTGASRHGAESETVGTDETTFVPTLVIKDSAWQILDDDHFDGREAGGYLAGPVAEPDVITHAIVAFIDDEARTWRSVRLDLDEGLAFWNSLPSDLTLRGCWHQHPNGTHAEPSSVDLESARGAAKTYARPWIELVLHNKPIFTPGIDGRARESSVLEMTATMFRPDGESVRAQVFRS